MRFLLPAALLLAACGADPALIPVPETAPGPRVAVPFRSIEVREVSLPTYAEAEEIHVETPDGVIAAADGLAWADDPARAVTLDLAAAMDAVTGARVAAEPWPYETFPAARVTVRATEMVAGRDGRFRISGQYAVGVEEGGRERGGRFAVSAPYAAEAGAAGIAAARAAAVRDLARLIAVEGM